MSEYIVTLKDHNDLDDFYTQMEESSGNTTIPSRKCTCTSRRTISRNTNYDLSEQEALELSKDSRVLAVEEPPEKRGIEPVPLWDQTADFQKNLSTISSTDKNWGLFRTINGASVANWGNDNTTSHNATIKTTSSGKNVDVVVVDRHLASNHPEFAVNADGTGGSRFVNFNWFQYSSALGYSSNATYSYMLGTSSHGTHVAGTVAGNTQGWARDANIYNMEFASDAGGNNGVAGWTNNLWDYLRHFHKNKDINPATGRRNPTITNHSWGYSQGTLNLSTVGSVTYRGTTTVVSGSTSERQAILESKGCPCLYGVYLYRIPARVASVDADVADAIADGVVVIGAAGNSYWPMDVPGGQDYDNSIDLIRYHTRGMTPAAATDVICVGSVGSKVAEYKSTFSNFDRRIDVWASGSNIISSMGTAQDPYAAPYPVNATDPRDSNYRIAAISGTSMSSPQVTGYIACLSEQEPNLTNADVLQHLIENSKANVADAGASNPVQSPNESLADSPNRWLFYVKKRPESGVAYPSITQNNRNPSTNGVKYPRSSSLVTKTS
tara:strand:+ start:11477 stop:13132 length:1656 start_codon:yes stop_codon:yes gene_type:complete